MTILGGCSKETWPGTTHAVRDDDRPGLDLGVIDGVACAILSGDHHQPATVHAETIASIECYLGFIAIRSVVSTTPGNGGDTIQTPTHSQVAVGAATAVRKF